VFKAKLT